MAEEELAHFIDRWTIEYVRIYPHPIERVWRAISDPKEFGAWFIRGEIELKQGGSYRFESEDWTGSVLAIDPPRYIKFGNKNEPTGYFQYELSEAEGGTRMRFVQHFPSDGEYKFSIQNFGVGTYVLGEQLEFLVDGERVKLLDYVGVGLSQGMSGENDGSIDVTVPVKAGSHVVGATFVETNYRPSLNIVKEFERKSLDNNSIAQLQYYPVVGFFRISGPFLPQRPADSRSMRKVLTCKPLNASQ